MQTFHEYIGSQFANPRGFVGKCCCIIMNIINNAMYRRTISLLSLKENDKMLDVGYGNGYLLKLTYTKYPPCLYGIDISEDMKTIAEERMRKAQAADKLHLSVGNCCALPYEDDFFDAITTINTVYFWDDTLRGLQEIKRTLKPGGCFYNVVYTKEWLQKLSYTRKGFRFFEPEDFLRLGKEAGFSKVSVQDIVKGKSFVVTFRLNLLP